MIQPSSIFEAYFRNVIMFLPFGDLSYTPHTIDFRIRMREHLASGHREFIVIFTAGSNVKFVDSSFIGELIYWTKEVAKIEGGKLFVTNLNKRVGISLEQGEAKDLLKIARKDPAIVRV